MNAQDLLQEIADYCRHSGLAESTFGRRAVNDGKLTARLRNGGRITTQTLDRIRGFMETNRTVITGYGAFVFGSFIDSVLGQMTRAQMTAAANQAFKEHEPGWSGTNPVVMTGENKGPRG